MAQAQTSARSLLRRQPHSRSSYADGLAPDRFTRMLSKQALLGGGSGKAPPPQSEEQCAQWNAMQRGLRVAHQVAAKRMEVQAKQRADAARGADHVVWEVSSGQQHKVSFALQADEALNTREAHEQRLWLRRTRLVREALHEWWEAVPHLLVRVLGTALDESDLVQEATVEREVYAIVLRAIYGALAHDEEWSDEELDAQVAEDWATDARGQASGG